MVKSGSGFWKFFYKINNTVEPRLSELIGTAPSSDTQKFGYWKYKIKVFIIIINILLELHYYITLSEIHYIIRNKLGTYIHY